MDDLSAFLLVMVGLFAAGVLGDFRPANLTAPLVLLFWVPLLAVHEGGHAAAAAVLGWRVRQVVVGAGKAVGRFRLGAAAVEVRLVPVEGFVRCVPTRLRLPRLEYALIYLAGPGSELLLAAGALAAAGPGRVFSPAEGYGVVAWRSLVIAAGSQAALNLLPVAVATRDGVLHSDGLGMVVSLFRPTSHYARMMERDGGAEARADDPHWAAGRAGRGA